MSSSAPAYVPGHGLLDGKRVVITAAAGAGIGQAAAVRCLEEGAALVVLGDTHAGRLAETQSELGDRFGADRVRTAVCDVTVEDQVAALLDLAEDGGAIDVMINNAGLGGSVSILDMTDEQWDRVIDVTLTGTFRCLRAVGRRMVAAGTAGVIVNNASVTGWRAGGAGSTTPPRRPA